MINKFLFSKKKKTDNTDNDILIKLQIPSEFEKENEFSHSKWSKQMNVVNFIKTHHTLSADYKDTNFITLDFINVLIHRYWLELSCNESFLNKMKKNLLDRLETKIGYLPDVIIVPCVH